ncbi:unnamed protein product [Knipowitschia caucasica]|uniref:protein disulfide-isomerase n=1 Tax=Knipowitschia caucasica TaxID=637954 RepID=A0AAV2JVY3_KNICA
MASLVLLLLLSGLLCPAQTYVEELSDTFWENHGKDETWIIKFYTPWCRFCKQLDPIWSEIGSELRNLGSPVQVGRVDATSQTALAKEFKVRTYPAFFLLKNERKYEYTGPKTKEAILDFTYRVSGPAVRSLSSPQLVSNALSRHSVLFLFVGASSPLKSNFTATAQELIIHTHFYSTIREHLPKWVSVTLFPAVLVFKDDTYIPFDPAEGVDLRTWVNRERFQRFCKLNSFTLYSMGDSGRPVLVSVLGNSRSEQSLRSKSLVQKISTDYKSEFRDMYFGFLEDTDFISGLMMSDDITVPLLLVLNLTNDSYFLPPGDVATEQDLVQFLNAVMAGTLEAQGGNSVIQRIKRFGYEVKVTLSTVFQEAPVFGVLLVSIPSGVILSLLFLVYKACATVDEDDDDNAAAVSTAAQKRHKRKKSD